jgi:hypothetical protein
VKARVLIGRNASYIHDCGRLGTASDLASAVASWGKIEWQEDGLHIGGGTNRYFLPRARLESHR